MTDDIAKVAKGLTKAQLWALQKGDGFMIAGSTTPACRCALQRLGIVIDRQYSERLTPLGIRVKAYLQSKGGEV